MDNKKKEYRMLARMRAKAYLQNKHHLKGSEKRSYLRKCKKEAKLWKASLSSMDKEERRLQNQAFRAYKRRRYRLRNWILFLFLIVIVVALLYFFPQILFVLTPYWVHLLEIFKCL